jgi:pimeloyl-ACP methyl ester carboxylesterase
MDTDIEERSIIVDGYRLHYLTAGDSGPVVCLLHGGIIDAAHLSWGAAIEALADDFQVIALDLLGYGESEIPDIEYSTALHVDVVGAFLDAIDVGSANVVGVSLGGSVALGLALGEPEKVDRLVVVDSFGLGRDLPNGDLSYALSRVPALNRLSVALLRRSRRLARASLGAILYDPDAIPDELVDAFYSHLQRPGVGLAFRRWRGQEVTREGYRTVYVDRLGEIDAPTLVLHGAADELFPVAWAERAAERLPEGDLRVFEECGHWLPREKPAACNEAIATFLRE